MAHTTTSDTPTSVYRYYDRLGVLIYVGLTRTRTERNQQHNGDKDWWPLVASQAIDHFQTREEAIGGESALIAKFRPPFNTQQNPEHQTIKAAYLASLQNGDLARD